jgi:hypothetical protein
MNNESFNPGGEDGLINRVAEFFDSKQWSYDRVADMPVIHLCFSGESARWQCVAIADPKAPHLVFMSLLPCRVPPNRRAQLAELFARINWGLTHGCFELNADSGEVRLRTSLSLPSPEVSLDLIGELVFSNLWAADHFFGVIMQVVYTKIAPRRALAALKDSLKTKPKAAKPIDQQRRFELN